ncbi:MAG: trypsin-like peptidase domain-containing protein [Holosporales bacterium]|jgi:serine protease Do|nr:trypsin-like peptidase domain-containing protein [Holosporales bacterium]
MSSLKRILGFLLLGTFVPGAVTGADDMTLVSDVEIVEAPDTPSDNESATSEENDAEPDASDEPASCDKNAPHEDKCCGACKKCCDDFLKHGFSEVVARITNSVVSIVAVQTQKPDERIEQFGRNFHGSPFEDFFRNFSGANAQPRRVSVGGSGFFIHVNDEYAYVATNNHIVENVVKVKILLSDKTELPAVVHGTDPRTDLAVLKIDLKDVSKEARHMIVPLKWGDSSKADVGQWVLAIGNPFGLGNTVTHGIVSATSRDIPNSGHSLSDDFLQHSAQINQGNSGGCLVNVHGEVIGINTVIITPSGGNVGIGFAIPSNNARRIVSQLIDDKRVRHGALGVSVQDFDKDMAEGLGLKKYKNGAIVARVEPDGPASKAGIRDGDIIVKFDDIEVSGKSKLSRAVGDARVDTTHKVVVLRKVGGDEFKEFSIDVKLGDFDIINGNASLDGAPADNKPISILGMTLADSSKGSEEKGVGVLNVKPDSAAEEAGITSGDFLTEVNRIPVLFARDFRDAVLKALDSGKRYLTIRVKRDKFDRFVAIRIDEDDELKKMVKDNQKNTDKKKKHEKKRQKELEKERKKHAHQDEATKDEARDDQSESQAVHPNKNDVVASQEPSAAAVASNGTIAGDEGAAANRQGIFVGPSDEPHVKKHKEKSFFGKVLRVFKKIGKKIAKVFD